MASDGSETILIAEDQESIRVLIKAFLEQRGYTVLAAEDGLEAISLLNDYPQTIDLLVTDVLLPGIDGGGVVKRSLERRPTIQVLYVTGFGEEAIPDGSAPFLLKPFRLEELAQKIRAMLNNSRSTSREL
jgi:two-component system, cell cycle sensor histidine kinase and response regulator CckA